MIKAASKPLSTPTLDCHPPKDIARKVQDAGVAKANLAFWPTFGLAILAGVFIGLGAEFFTLVSTGNTIGFGLAKLIGGLVFSLGLILVVVAGAELFTGNNLLTLAWINRAISFRQVLRNWGIVYLGNLLGSVALALLMFWTKQWASADLGVGAAALKIAAGKTALPFGIAFARGILCNLLVCLAVWLCFSARTVADKILAILFPITAFVASGFEHSVANMYFIPIGMLLKTQPDVISAAGLSAAQLGSLTVWGFVANLVPVTLGNLIGGGVMVGALYWSIFLRGKKEEGEIKHEAPLMETVQFTLPRPMALPESVKMISRNPNGKGVPLCSYILASGDMFIHEANQREIYVRDDPVEGFQIWGEIPGQDAIPAADLGQILLEYSMSCLSCGNIPQAYRQMDAFGKHIGEALAVKMIEGMPARDATLRAIAALQCVFESMKVTFKVQEIDGKVSYVLDHCPLCKKADETGVRHVELAHHGLNALCQSQVDALAPGLALRLPSDPTIDHTFSVITTHEAAAAD
jgi:formate/nitrite transporter